MKRRDLILIIISILLISAVFLIGAKADWIRAKLGIGASSSIGLIVKLDEKTPTEAIADATGSEAEEKSNTVQQENFFISSPKPNEIIKGTNFIISGRVKDFNGILNIEVSDRQTGEIWLATTTVAVFSLDQDFGDFEKEISVAPHGGWATVKIFCVSAQNSWVKSLISFPVLISPSI